MNQPQPFCISIAGLTAELHPLTNAPRRYCADYLVEDTTPDIVSRASEEEIQQEIAVIEGAHRKAAEIVVLYRQIADRLPSFNAVVFHGAAIEYEGKAYLFTAPSGTGKTTHINLWFQHLGDKVRIINGDKPILRLTENGVDVCSTPWAGKERWQRNCIVPLGAICLLRRGETNRIEKASPLDHFDPLLRQAYCPPGGEALDKTLQILDTMLSRVPFYVLDCTISKQAVEVALEAMTGGKLDENS